MLIFRFLRRFASRRPAEETPAQAEVRFGQLAAGEDLAPHERAFFLNKRGVARIALGRRDEARADFETALACDARCAPAMTNLGNLLLEDGDVGGAIAAYERAIAADGNYRTAYFNLSAAYKRAGRFDDAVRAFHAGRRSERR